MAKWLAGILATVTAVIVIFWVIEQYRSPTPSQQPPSPAISPAVPHVETEVITVRCSAIPRVLAVGGQAELIIQAVTLQNTPVFAADVKVDADAGEFPSSGSTTVTGRSDNGGSFRTKWRSPIPAEKAYLMRVTVSKQGFVDGRGECRAIIR